MEVVILIAAAVLFAASLVVLVYKIREVQKIHQEVQKLKKHLDMEIVKSVMEHDPDIANKVIETHHKLVYNNGYIGEPDKAMIEARRLHGLDP